MNESQHAATTTGMAILSGVVVILCAAWTAHKQIRGVDQTAATPITIWSHIGKLTTYFLRKRWYFAISVLIGARFWWLIFTTDASLRDLWESPAFWAAGWLIFFVFVLAQTTQQWLLRVIEALSRIGGTERTTEQREAAGTQDRAP